MTIDRLTDEQQATFAEVALRKTNVATVGRRGGGFYEQRFAYSLDGGRTPALAVECRCLGKHRCGPCWRLSQVTGDPHSEICTGGCASTGYRPLTEPGDQLLALLAWVRAQDEETRREIIVGFIRSGSRVHSTMQNEPSWADIILLNLTLPNLLAAVEEAAKEHDHA